jgi:hypothetical protein
MSRDAPGTIKNPKLVLNSKSRKTESTLMNTKKIKDRAERKKLKRAARKKQAPKPKQTEPRGSMKPKVKKKGTGTASKR